MKKITINDAEMIADPPQKALLKFSLPLLAGSIFQNLYNIFDTMIVGQMLGKEALAAVGNSYVPMLIINSVLLGISSGISILISQFYGSQEQDKIGECVGSVQAINAIIGIGLTIVSFVAGKYFFSAMNIPGNILSLATDYWRINAIGIPFLTLYNFYSAIIKAKGNSKIPVKIIGISCVINIFLDCLYVGVFHLGVQGAAMATITSQAIAAGATIKYLYRHDREILTTHPNLHKILMIIKLSITGIVQNSASAMSMFCIQGIINQYGVNAISAYTSAYKIESILTIPAANLGTALSVFVGQNIGAGNTDRTRQGLKAGFRIAAIISLIVILIIWVFAPALMYLLVGNEKSIIEIGVKYLHIISFTFPFCVSLYLLTNFLRGAGEVFYPLFNTLLELSVRTVLAYVLADNIGFVGVLLCRPISFVVSAFSLLRHYFSKKWEKLK